MKRFVEKRVFYKCSKCKTKHSSKKDAARCEKKVIEKKMFAIGEAVRNIDPRTCQAEKKDYNFLGTVVKIIGPEPADYEYEVKWLGGKPERINSHVFRYEVAFNCPHCGEERRERYYAPELAILLGQNG